jgi:hypothetical protein
MPISAASKGEGASFPSSRTKTRAAAVARQTISRTIRRIINDSLASNNPRVIPARVTRAYGISMPNEILDAGAFRAPSVLLSGTVDYAMYNSFREQLGRAPVTGLIVVVLSTLGGDPEVARMMGEDVRYHSELDPERHFVFLGKAALYSAGTTFMSFFARDNRYLTRGTRLMIHERKLNKTLNIDGPLTTCIATVKATLHEIQASIEIQNEGFENLIAGSNVTMDQVLERAPYNWYIEAQEALALGLIRAIL